MSTRRVRPHELDPWISTALSLTLLLSCLALALFAIAALDVILVGAWVIGLALWSFRRWRHPSSTEGRDRRHFHPRAVLELVLYLSPILLLGLAYPLSSRRLSVDQVGGVPLTTMLLAASVTVPWLTQAVCLPLYRALAPQIERADITNVKGRFCDVWPSAFARSLPAIAVFAVPVELATRWGIEAIGAYLVLCVLYVLFAQSLLISIVSRNRFSWAVAWSSLAVTLFLVPGLWFLPPLVAVVTQVVPLRGQLHRLKRPARLAWGAVVVDLGRGLILGSVLWSDKLVLFLRNGSHFAITAVYLGLLPAILVYNYYFVALAPRFDVSVKELRGAMESDSVHHLLERSEALSRYVAKSIGRTGLAGAALALTVTAGSALVAPSTEALIASVAVASWFFMMTTLLCYKLDYIGQRRLALTYSAAHLAVSTAVLFALPISAASYLWLSCFEVVIFAGALLSVSVHWRSAEYNLFWRHATAW